MNKFLRQAIPLLLALTLLIYALKDISLISIVHQFQQANYLFILLALISTVLSYWLRGKRWQQPLRSLGYAPTAFRGTVSIVSGMVASMIVPGSGEVTRCLTLQRTDGVPFAQGMGSVVAERVLDLLMLLVVLLITFILEFGRMQAYMSGLTFGSLTGIVSIVLVGLIFIAIIFYGIWQLPFIKQHPVTSKIITFSQGLWEGFSAIRRLPSPTLFVALTVYYQILVWLISYLLLLSLDLTKSLPPTAALTILAVSSIGGLAVPTQGGVGTYHFLVSRALVLYGLSTAEGALVATFMHAVGFGINLVLSSISFMIIPVLVQKRQEHEQVNEKN